MDNLSCLILSLGACAFPFLDALFLHYLMPQFLVLDRRSLPRSTSGFHELCLLQSLNIFIEAMHVYSQDKLGSATAREMVRSPAPQIPSDAWPPSPAP